MAKTVLIIGGGFAGLSAAGVLSKYRDKLKVVVVDKSGQSDFLPMLPDVIGRRIPAKYLSGNIRDLSRKNGFEFIADEVIGLDLINKTARTVSRELKYDYVIIASGSETNFYGNTQIQSNAYKLDSASDAQKIYDAVAKNNYQSYLIGGGGYTGIEVATNLRAYLHKKGIKNRIIIIERASSILGLLPQWMKDYVSVNLRKLDIEVMVNSAIEKVEGSKIMLGGGVFFDNAMLIWAAGVKTAGFIQNLDVKKNPQGRIFTDEYLKVDDSCFVAGDTACVLHNSGILRMAVQFAIMQGERAAVNVLKSIQGKKLIKFCPVDLGYIIPMANNRSCGVVLGINLKGFIPTLFHYIMCLYRLGGFRDRRGVLIKLTTGG